MYRSLTFVGVAGFEPTTSSTPCWRATELRYTPKRGTNVMQLHRKSNSALRGQSYI